MKLNLASLSHYPAPIRLAVFVLALLLLWIPLAGCIYFFVSDRNTVSILTLILLYGEFILLVQFWGWRVYRQSNLLWCYGLEFSRRFGWEVLAGLTIGVVSLFALFFTQGVLGWIIWQTPSPSILRTILEGLLIALFFGFAEELLFRGWLLDELQRDYRPDLALGLDAVVYAGLHFIKPLAEIYRTFPQFPALVLLGLTLGWAKRSRGDFYQASRNRWSHPVRRDRLGLPMGLHAGLVWGYYIISVGKLVEYSNRVPEWVTGIDRNPLSGAIGLLFLGALALGVRYFAQRQPSTRRSY